MTTKVCYFQNEIPIFMCYLIVNQIVLHMSMIISFKHLQKSIPQRTLFHTLHITKIVEAHKYLKNTENIKTNAL